MTHADGDHSRRPGPVACVVFAAVWVALAVWFLSSGQTWPGVGAGIPAAAWLIAAARRRAARRPPISETPPTAAR